MASLSSITPLSIHQQHESYGVWEQEGLTTPHHTASHSQESPSPHQQHHQLATKLTDIFMNEMLGGDEEDDDDDDEVPEVKSSSSSSPPTTTIHHHHSRHQHSHYKNMSQQQQHEFLSSLPDLKYPQHHPPTHLQRNMSSTSTTSPGSPTSSHCAGTSNTNDGGGGSVGSSGEDCHHLLSDFHSSEGVVTSSSTSLTDPYEVFISETFNPPQPPPPSSSHGSLSSPLHIQLHHLNHHPHHPHHLHHFQQPQHQHHYISPTTSPSSSSSFLSNSNGHPHNGLLHELHHHNHHHYPHHSPHCSPGGGCLCGNGGGHFLPHSQVPDSSTTCLIPPHHQTQMTHSSSSDFGAHWGDLHCDPMQSDFIYFAKEHSPTTSDISFADMTDSELESSKSSASGTGSVSTCFTETFNVSPPKRKVGRPPKPNKKKRTEKKTGRLWEFIRDLLKNPEYCPSLVRWENPEEGHFRFVNSEKVAQLWGQIKGNPRMTYEKLSRAMRYYYKSHVFEPVLGRRLVYKFGYNATNWRPTNPNFIPIAKVYPN